MSGPCKSRTEYHWERVKEEDLQKTLNGLSVDGWDDIEYEKDEDADAVMHGAFVVTANREECLCEPRDKRVRK